jgi:hypothetical protein
MQQPIVLYRKTVGVPTAVGVSQGGLYAFMVGTQRVKSGEQILERPIVFVGAKPNPVPNAEQWIAVPHLIRFSQPNAWTFDDAAIAQAISHQLVDALSPSDKTDA